MNIEKVCDGIVGWLNDYASKAGSRGFVIGVSGGIDSAVVSTLCAMTKMPVIAVSLPIFQDKDQVTRADQHLEWLKGKYPNITTDTIDLSGVMTNITESLGSYGGPLALANTRSRLRMATLYGIANEKNYLVAGTGNKVEDFGIGFFTKYGDGGVDISPIGDLLKTQVWELGSYLQILPSIIQAKPNDGLWGDGRSDEDQIGATYAELEWAMSHCEAQVDSSVDKNKARIAYLEQTIRELTSEYINCIKDFKDTELQTITPRQREVLDIYLKRHVANKHKMDMPPICKIGAFNV